MSTPDADYHHPHRRPGVAVASHQRREHEEAEQEEFADIADRLAVMYAFQLAEVGPTEAIVDDPAHPYTRALIKAVPNVSEREIEIAGIPGSSPDPVNVPEGCAFNPRCPLADEQCQREDPEFRSVGNDHEAACFHWENAAAEIPFQTEGDDADGGRR